MVFPAAIREKSQRGVALSCDAHVVSAKSVGIRQPCTESLSESTFLSVQHFCAGNYIYAYTCKFDQYIFIRTRPRQDTHAYETQTYNQNSRVWKSPEELENQPDNIKYVRLPHTVAHMNEHICIYIYVYIYICMYIYIYITTTPVAWRPTMM